MYSKFANELLGKTADFREKWEETLEILCKEVCIPEDHIRRFADLARKISERAKDLSDYGESLLAKGSILTVKEVGIYTCFYSTKLMESMHELENFLKHKVALGDSSRFKDLINEIDEIILWIAYAGEDLVDEDGTIFIIYIS